MTNRDIANKFFRELGSSFHDLKNHISFENYVYRSNNIAIGQITSDINGNKAIILADNTFRQPIVSKHFWELQRTAYENDYEVYIVPNDNKNCFNHLNIINMLERSLESLSNVSFKYKNNRDNFLCDYRTLKSLLNLEFFKSSFDKINSILKKHESVYEYVKNYKK